MMRGRPELGSRSGRPYPFGNERRRLRRGRREPVHDVGARGHPARAPPRGRDPQPPRAHGHHRASFLGLLAGWALVGVFTLRPSSRVDVYAPEAFVRCEANERPPYEPDRRLSYDQLAAAGLPSRYAPFGANEVSIPVQRVTEEHYLGRIFDERHERELLFLFVERHGSMHSAGHTAWVDPGAQVLVAGEHIVVSDPNEGSGFSTRSSIRWPIAPTCARS